MAKIGIKKDFYRSVYAYRPHGSPVITDNLLLLPFDTQENHKTVLEREFSRMFDNRDELHRPHFDVVRIGLFNVKTLTFSKSTEELIINMDELFDRCSKLAKENTHE